MSGFQIFKDNKMGTVHNTGRWRREGAVESQVRILALDVCVHLQKMLKARIRTPPRKIRGNDLCSQEAVRDMRSSADLESSRGFKAPGVMMGNDEP